MEPAHMKRLNKTLSLSLKQHRRGSAVDTLTFAVPVVFGLALILATFVLVVVVDAHFNIMGLIFFTFSYFHFNSNNW